MPIHQVMKSGRRAILLGVIMLSIFGCTSIPDGLRPVTGFDVQRYLGKWYEIARLDHSFERGLTNVSAEYALKPDGSVSVLNQGFNPAKQKWSQARGKAKILGDAGTGSLKVSFFGPFYGGYHILALDKEKYQWALVCGPDKSYLWILAREKTLDKAVLERLANKARGWGFDTQKLIFVEQD